MTRWDFYKQNLNKHINKNSNVLVIGGSEDEYKLYKNLGYKNFTISNLQSENNKFSFEILNIDATNIPYQDNHFDYVVTHACLHHMRKPHSALTEMYRVSKIGTLIIEGNDSLIMKLSSLFGFSEKFEISSVDKANKKGGVEESGVPNYIYRWTEREIYKTLSSFEPETKHIITFNYSNDLRNEGVQNNSNNNALLVFLKMLLKLFFLIFQKQQNLLSIFIDKKSSAKRTFKI